MTVIKDKLAATTETPGHLVVMIAISVLLAIRQGLIPRNRAGKTVLREDMTSIQIGLMNILAMRQSKSYSKATTSILIEATLLNPRYKIRINQRNAMSHVYPMGGY